MLESESEYSANLVSWSESFGGEGPSRGEMSRFPTLENRRLLALALKEECMREVEEEEDEVRIVFMDGMEMYMHKALLCLLSPFLRGLLPDIACPILLLPDYKQESMALLLRLIQGNSGDENLVPSSLASLVFDLGLNVPLDKSAEKEVTVLEEHVLSLEEEMLSENVVEGEHVSLEEEMVAENVVNISGPECETEPPLKKSRLTESAPRLPIKRVRVIIQKLEVSKRSKRTEEEGENDSTERTKPNTSLDEPIEDEEPIQNSLKPVKSEEKEEALLKQREFAVRDVSVRLKRLKCPNEIKRLMGAKTGGSEAKVSSVRQLENITQWIDHHIGTVGEKKAFGKSVKDFRQPVENESTLKSFQSNVKDGDQEQKCPKREPKKEMGVDRNATVGLSPKRRNNVLIECNSDEDSPELTLEIIQDLLLSQEERTSGDLGTGDSILNQEEAEPDGDEDDDIVELEPPKKIPIMLVDLEQDFELVPPMEQEDLSDAMLFKSIDKKLSELEKLEKLEKLEREF